MTDFYASWQLSRGRFDETIQGLTGEQLNWRLHDKTLTNGEAALHVAGVELYFCSQLLGRPDLADPRLIACATQGVVDDQPFPFSADEITPEFVAESLALARRHAEPVIKEPSPQLLQKEIKSALGPIITGQGALARLAFHPAYHQGQAYLLLMAPGFPRG